MKKKLIATMSIALLLGGCISADMRSLQSYVEEVKSRPGGYIEPLPEIKPAERYLYLSTDLRDPFDPTFSAGDESETLAIDTKKQRLLQREITQRNKEELEYFELDSLRLVGTLEQSKKLWGIIQDKEGIIYRVAEGNYIGRNYGKILSISEEKIQIREIVKDFQGAWEERKASIVLTDVDEA